MDYKVIPIVVVDEPRPVGYNGAEIDLTQGIKDHDPTTAQSLEDTEYELAMEEMAEGGSGLSLSFSFLDKDEVIKLSGTLYEFMNSGDGVETIYTCGPLCRPVLGGTGSAGGVINSINYSYSDRSAYTISVNEGSRLVGGFAQVDGGVYIKQVEDVTVNGTIIQDVGNGVHYKVRLDDFGERIAINECPNILRVGDKVSCTVHNCPVEG